MALSARARRNKGKVGERETATDLRIAFPEFARRIARGWQSREGDDDPDVKFPGLWVENKKLAKFNTSPLDQAIREHDERGMPIAVIRANHKKPVTMMLWTDFLRMLRLIFVAYKSTDVNNIVMPKKKKTWIIRIRRSSR